MNPYTGPNYVYILMRFEVSSVDQISSTTVQLSCSFQTANKPICVIIQDIYIFLELLYVVENADHSFCSIYRTEEVPFVHVYMRDLQANRHWFDYRFVRLYALQLDNRLFYGIP